MEETLATPEAPSKKYALTKEDLEDKKFQAEYLNSIESCETVCRD